MASQTNGRNTEEQGAVRGTPNRSDRRPGTSPPDIQTLRTGWNRLQLAGQRVAASSGELYNAQAFFGAQVDALASYQGMVERRGREYYQAYTAQVDEMNRLATRNSTLQQEVEKAEALTDAANHKAKELNAVSTHLAERNITLQEEVEKANGLTDAANRRAEELDAVSTNLAERNVSLQQDLDQANEMIRISDHKIREFEVSSCELASGNLALQQDLFGAYERIRILESRVAGADPPSADASGSENKAHELDTGDQKSPDAIIKELRAELTALEGEYDKMLVNASERISVASKGASPSPGGGGGPKAEESKHGKRKYKRGRGKPRK